MLQHVSKKNSCPVCYCTPEYLYTIDRFESIFNIMRCPGCGLQMQSDIPEDASIFYTEAYYSGKAEYNYHDERRHAHFDRHVWRARLKTIQKYVPAPADFLDVGCAFGGLVGTAAEMGYRALGLDISKYAVAQGRAAGLNLQQGNLNPGIFPNRSIDIVTMIEVMEHIEQPLVCMRTLRDLIRPGGLLVIQTANFLGYQARKSSANYHYYLPGHFYYYSTYTLTRLLQRYGFGNFRIYHPVDFGLLPKLLKSRGSFQSPGDYLKWNPITRYHILGHLACRHLALTSSMVLYARRLK